MIFALTKTASIRIFYNIDKESKNKVICSLNSKAVYNGGKQIGIIILSSYSAYLMDWIKFKVLCNFYKKKYSSRDIIWKVNCWDHTYYKDCLFNHYRMNYI